MFNFKINEKKIIKEILLPLTLNNSMARGLEDDVCEIKNNKNIIATSDSIVEGWHLISTSAITLDHTLDYYLGWKLLARNVSDIVCKCATPYAYMLNLFLPASWCNDDYTRLKNFTHGLEAFANTLAKNNIHLPLIGGDITKSNAGFSASVTIFGKSNFSIPKRQGAKSGDKIFCTGKLGYAWKGLEILSGKSQDIDKQAISHYLTPIPPIWLTTFNATLITSCTDISDGLESDLANLTQGLNANINLDSIRDKNLPDKAINFGDEYQMICTSTHDLDIIDSRFIKIGIVY